MSDSPPFTGLSPEDAFGRAVSLHQAGRLDEAEAIYRHLRTIAPDHPEVMHLLGVVYSQTGRHAEAVDLIGRAARAMPDNAVARFNHGNALMALRDFAAAADAFASVLRQVPDHAEAAFNLGQCLRRQGRDGDAAGHYERALGIRPDYAPALAELADIRNKAGHYGDAVALLERAVAAGGGDSETRHQLGFVHLKRGDWQSALDAFDAALAEDAFHVRSLAFKGVALHEMGRDGDARRLVDLDRLVTVLPPETGASALAPDPALVAAVAAHPSLTWEPGETTTRDGAQTANLVADTEPSIAAFVAALTARIERFVAALPTDPAHPFLARRPAAWRYSIWATVLQRDGHQAPHLHPSGWLSGVYYLEVPDYVLSPENAGQEGWIEFGGSGYGIEPVRAPELRRVRPEPGALVLFPSFVFHRTVPLRREVRRISIAFDLIPTAWRDAGERGADG